MSNDILPYYDFSIPLALSVEQRFHKSVQLVRDMQKLLEKIDYGTDTILIPSTGSSPEEFVQLQTYLGIELPEEYGAFLQKWRSLRVDYSEVYGPESGFGPWVSDEHDPLHKYLVVGKCKSFSDGDELLIELDQPEQRVFQYVYEAWVYVDVPGAKIELYAPSFSLAIWRLIHDWYNWFVTECDVYEDIQETDPRRAEQIRNLVLYPGEGRPC